MVAHCCVYGCGNTYNKDGIKLFRLPTSDPEKLFVWLTLIGRMDLLKKSHKQKLTQRICSEHFSEEYYKYGKTLHKNAMPCRNLIILSEEGPSTSNKSLCLKRKNSCRIDDTLNKATKKRVIPMQNVKIIDIKEGSRPKEFLTMEAFLESCDQYLDEKTSKIVKQQLALNNDHEDATIKEEETQIQDIFAIKEQVFCVNDEQDPLLEVAYVLEGEVKPTYTIEKDNITNSTGIFENSEKAFNVKSEEKDWVSNKTESLIKMCKPFSIILVDCKPLLRYKFCTRHKKFKFGDNVLKCKTCVSFYNVNEKLKGKMRKYASMVLKKNPYHSNSNKQCPINERNEKFYDVWVVMSNSYINSTEIFYINRDLETLTDYYYLNHIISNKTELLSFTKDNKRFEFINCCWQKRHKHLMNVWPKVIADSLAMLVNIIPHACPPNNCLCCCNEDISSEVNNVSANAESKSLHSVLKIPSEKVRSDFQLFQSKADENNKNGWIDMALQYQRKPKPETFKRVAVSQSSSVVPHYVVKIKTPFRNFEYLHVLGPDAQMLSYMKLCVYNRSHQAYKALLSKYKFVNEKACNFSKRQKILSEMPCQIINFLQKTPHSDIVCTQKNKYCYKFTTQKQEQTFTHTKRNTARLKEVLESINKLSTNIVRHECIWTCINRNSKDQSHNLQIKRKYIRSRGRPKTSHNSLPSKRRVKPQEKNNKQSGNTLTDKSIIPMSMTTIPQPAEPTQEDPTVKALIASILERFKNIHLSLSAEGKVVALLDAPANSLSNEELTILSDILTRAQEQIKSFGIIDSSSSNLADPLNANQNIHIGITNSRQISTDVIIENSPDASTNDIPFDTNLLCMPNQDNLNEIEGNSALEEKEDANEKIKSLIINASSSSNLADQLNAYQNIQISVTNSQQISTDIKIENNPDASTNDITFDTNLLFMLNRDNLNEIEGSSALEEKEEANKQIKTFGIINISSSSLADPLNGNQNIQIGVTNSQQLSTDIKIENSPDSSTNDIPFDTNLLFMPNQDNLNEIEGNSALEEKEEANEQIKSLIINRSSSSLADPLNTNQNIQIVVTSSQQISTDIKIENSPDASTNDIPFDMNPLSMPNEYNLNEIEGNSALEEKEEANEQIKCFGIIDSSSSNLAGPPIANQNIQIVITNPQQISTDIIIQNSPDASTTDIPFDANTLFMPNQDNLNKDEENSALEEEEKVKKQIYTTSDLYELYSNLSYLKNEQIKHSLESHSKHGEQSLVPKIMNIYALNKDQTVDKITRLPSDSRSLLKDIAKPTVKRTYQNKSRLKNASTAKRARTDSQYLSSLKNDHKAIKTPVIVPQIVNENISMIVLNQSKNSYLARPIPLDLQTNCDSPAMNLLFDSFLDPENVDSIPHIKPMAIQKNPISMQHTTIPQNAPIIIITDKTDNKDDEDYCILGV